MWNQFVEKGLRWHPISTWLKIIWQTMKNNGIKLDLYDPYSSNYCVILNFFLQIKKSSRKVCRLSTYLKWKKYLYEWKYEMLTWKSVPFLLRKVDARVRNIWFLSPIVPSTWERNIQTETTYLFVSVHIFFEGSVFTFQFLNDESAKWIFLT